MSSIIKDIENDLEHMGNKIRSIHDKISKLSEDNKKEYRELMRLLSVFNKDKMSLLSLYHNIVTDITIKRKLLEAQRVKFEAEAMRLLVEDTERSEYDEQFTSYMENVLKRTTESIANFDEELIRQQVLGLKQGGDKNE